MDCLEGIFADVLNTCEEAPIGGLEVKVWVFNQDDVTATIDPTNRNLVTALALPLTKQGYVIQGFKKNLNAGHAAVVSETNIDKYAQNFNFQAWLLDAAAVQGLDGLSNLMVVVQRKNKMTDGDGAFKIYGLETGLYKTTDDENANDNDGNRLIAMATNAGEESIVSAHIFFDTDIATTVAALDALLVPQV